jgi:flagellar L-ring protein FlgH
MFKSFGKPTSGWAYPRAVALDDSTRTAIVLARSRRHVSRIAPPPESRAAFRVVLSAVALAAMVLFLSGCQTIAPTVAVHTPTSARPIAAAAVAMPARAPATQGAIFNAASYNPLFEDRRARHVGDLVTIQITEKTSASRKTNSSTDKGSEAGFAVPAVAGLPGKVFQGANLKANSNNKFEGKGSTSGENEFNGTITATVVEVLPNGNLLVAGEKQIGINANTEFVRFSGVVNPQFMQPGNTVASTQVADVRIDYRGKGYINEAQHMPWLQRVFLNVLPF